MPKHLSSKDSQLDPALNGIGAAINPKPWRVAFNGAVATVLDANNNVVRWNTVEESVNNAPVSETTPTLEDLEKRLKDAQFEKQAFTDALRYRWLRDRGIAWRECYGKGWEECEWAYGETADVELDHAMRPSERPRLPDGSGEGNGGIQK